MDNSDHHNDDQKAIIASRVVRSTDPDTFSDPESARVRARQLGCIGIRRYMNRNGGQSWMPCTNESDYRKYSGQGHSGRQFRRQQLDRAVRDSIGRNYGRTFKEKSANYTKPELRERLKQRIMSGSKGGRPGQWSARKAQLLALAYRKAGGGYKGGKSKKQRSLVRWGKEKWRTSDGKPAIRGAVTRRYLPAKAWARLTPAQRAATNRKKIAGSKRGRQFVDNTEAAASARKRISRGMKHIEFYEELDVKAVGSRLGGRIGRALAPGDGGGPRRGRIARRGRGVGGRMLVVPFDPNPVDADADLSVQEGTIHERLITPEQSLASRLGRGAVRIPTRQGTRRATRTISRGAPTRDSRITPSKKPRRVVGPRELDKPRKPRSPRDEIRIGPYVPEEDAGEIQIGPYVPGEDTGEIRIGPYMPDGLQLPEIEDRDEALRRFDGDFVAALTRKEKAQIFNDVSSGKTSVSELAERYSVVQDEVQDAIRDHKKFRTSSYGKFKKSNPKLLNSINNRFPNTKENIENAIRDGFVQNWDGLLNYALRSPGDKPLKEKITRELFDAFPRGVDPDGKSNMVLGYRKTRRRDSKEMVRDIADRTALPEGFIQSGQYRQAAPTIEARATSARNANERAARVREFRKYQRQADSGRMWGASITGRMASGPDMTPAEENDWRMRGWKRQQLKKLILSKRFESALFPSVADALGDDINGDVARAYQKVDEIGDDAIDALWDSTVLDLNKAGMRIPAYRANEAPLTPKELAIVANAKRPLVGAFIDEIKKLNPRSNFAQIDVNSLNDREVEDLFNTFIMPELTNPAAPTIQDIQLAAGLPKSQEMISLADSIEWAADKGFADLSIRTLIAREKLIASGMDPSDDAFEQALQELIDSYYNEEAGTGIDDLEKWLASGAPPLPPGPPGGFDGGASGGDGDGGIPINPDNGLPWDKQSLIAKIQELTDYVNDAPDVGTKWQRIMEVQEALSEVYEIGRQQGWIDEEGYDVDRPDDGDEPSGEDLLRDLPVEDEYGYPDSDEAWEAPYVDELGNEVPYDGSETHPLNVNPDTNQPYDVTNNNLLDADLYNFFLDPNNYHIREWMDLDNTHTVGRYTKPPAELAGRFYDGDIDDADPSKIDQRIDWDRLIQYISQVSPHFFTRNNKDELIANITEITRSGSYDGASFNPSPDPDADPTGYQLRAKLKEFVEAKRAEQLAELTSSTPAGKTRRAALWNLFETGTLTPEEIAFDENIFDPDAVTAALSMHALENKISQTKFRDIMRVARAAAPSREDSYAKKRVERIAQEFKDQGKTSREALREIDRAIEHQIELRTKVGLEYDQFRREYMAVRNMITSLLMMRPRNRKQTYNRDGSIRERGWDPKKESASRYLNRIARWDRQFIGMIDRDGNWRPGIVSQLVSRLRQMEIISGAVGGGGATSDIFKTADQNIERLREMRSLIEDARGEAKRFGITGMMRAGGMDARLFGRAETSARRAGMHAASGHFSFASPRTLKRYDDFGLPISRNTRLSASGFNKRLQNLINEARRARDFKWSDSPYFDRLPSRLKDIVRGLDSTPYTFSRRGFGRMFPSRTARRGARAGENIARPEDYQAFELLPNTNIVKSGKQKRNARSITGSMQLMVDNIDGKWYVTDRNGDIVVDSPSDTQDEALAFANSIQQEYRDKPEFPWNDYVLFDAYRKRVDTYRYHGESRIRKEAAAMNTAWVEGKARGPKLLAADSVIMRINPETGEKEVAMIRRGNPPFDSKFDVNLPGGFVEDRDVAEGRAEIDEAVFISTAMREQLEEVGVTADDIIKKEFIGENDEPDWDPRFPQGIRVGGVYFEVKPETQLRAGDDAKKAFWVPIKDLADGKLGIGFGHAGFISAMLWDDEPNLAERMSIVSKLARRRNQRIIREVNRQRALINAGRAKEDRIPLFPKELPSPDDGFIAGGPTAKKRAMDTFRRLTGRMSGSPIDNTELNDGVRYALVNYSGDGFGLLNQLLRETDGLVLDRNLIKNRSALRDAITTRDPSSLATRIAMGTDSSYDRLMRELEIYRDMNDWLTAGTIPEGTVLYRTLGGWRNIEGMKAGDEFFDAAFQSTTSNAEQGFLLGPRNLRIFVGKGVSGRELGKGIDAPRHDEDEVLLPAGVRYRILRAPEKTTSNKGDTTNRFWDVEIVSQGISGAMSTSSSIGSNINDGARRNGQNGSDNDLTASIKRSIVGKMAIPRKQFVGRDFYGDLDIQPTATLKQVKEAYREIAKKFHPDKNPGNPVAAEKFRLATEAYEVLSDAKERDYYDSTILPNVQRDAKKKASSAGSTSSPPRRPAWKNETTTQQPREKLPPLKSALKNRLGINIPLTDNIVPRGSSLSRYQRYGNEPGVKVRGPQGGEINLDEDRFWNVHFKIAEALNNAVTQKRAKGQKPRYFVIGGPPASGKSSFRLDPKSGIPQPNEAVHVDADEIKELIPEARIAHAFDDPDWASIVHDESRMITNTSLRMGLEKKNDIVHDSLGLFNEGLGNLKAAKEAGYEIIANYVVAPEDIIDARLIDREKTDPRKLPRHIAGAAIDSLKSRIIDVAEMADEFYLYDGTEKERVLIAQKQRGKKLEILDPRAFKYGYFEEMVPKHPLFDRPATDKRVSTVAKNNDMAQVIRDFDGGATVSELADKYKMSPRRVFRAVTEFSVDENRTEAPRPKDTRPPWDHLRAQGSLFDDWGAEADYSGFSGYKSSAFNQAEIEEMFDLVGDLVDEGRGDEILDFVNEIVTFPDNDITEDRFNDKLIGMIAKYGEILYPVLESRPSGLKNEEEKLAKKMIGELSQGERDDLTSIISSLVKEAKMGIFAPTSEFMMIAHEFGLPLWVVDDLFEDIFSS